MKYGKEFQQILADPALPSDWKDSAIEYGRLKKIIKSVVAELSGMGLSPHVLHKLLATEAAEAGEGPSPDREEDEEILEFEFESPDNSPPGMGRRSSMPHTPREAQEVIVDPVLPAPSDAHEGQGHHRTFRLRLKSDTPGEKPTDIRPMGVMDMVRSRTEQRRRASEPQATKGDRPRRRRRVVRATADDHGAVKARYVLVGEGDHPIPQLRLHLSTTPETSSAAPSSSTSQTTTDSEAEVTTSESEDEPDAPKIPSPSKRIVSPQHTPRPFAYHSPRMVPRVDVIPPSPTLQRLRQAVSPIWALASGNNVSDGLRDLSLDETPTLTASIESIQDDAPPRAEPSTSTEPLHPSAPSTGGSAAEPSPAERDFIIPLASDVAFFKLLTTALTSLSEFHSAQQEIFRASVEELCTAIRASIQPGSSPTVLSTPLTPTPLDPGPSTPAAPAVARAPPGKASKKDLYAWREIFTLWIEHEIFESNAERTRGERTVEQAQARLQAFANKVVQRGLGDRRTIRGKKARGAWEEFLRLNVLLLDLKRFQLANINAARKILKKHDKRTALTASAGFPSFVRSTLVNSVDKDGNISTWNFYNTSLPHVLLASLTDTLLPILPSLDDYACLICTSIAFKPIRLGCGHLFCVRCLVKMQRAGKAECPLCRSQVVLLANKDSLDMTLMRFMKEWFPKEVKEKQRENEREIAHEQAGAIVGAYHGGHGGGDADRCVVM